MDDRKNFAYATVLTAPSPATSGTTIVLSSGGGALMPTVPFNAVIAPINTRPTLANAEIVRVTNVASDTLTITRTQESTSARTVLVGDQFFASATAKTFDDIETELATKASSTDLTNHASDTTSVHGIADTSVLETTTGAQSKADAKVAQTITNGVTTSAPSQDAVFDALASKADSSALSTHESDTTSIHGIADTSVLETTSGAQAKADAKVTQNITNGVTTTAPSEDAVFDALANKADTTALTNHEADTTNIHGIADTSALETTSGAQSKADAKVADAINNGTTTVAPSQNAVFDALALKADDADLDAHIADNTDAHDSTAISYAPAGDMVSDNVGDAINEVRGKINSGFIEDAKTAMNLYDDFMGWGVIHGGWVGQLSWKVASAAKVTVNATAGNWTITYSGQTTGNIAYNATASTVQTALEALSNLDAGDVLVTGGPGDNGGTTPYYIQLIGNKIGLLPTLFTAVADVTLSGGGDSVTLVSSAVLPIYTPLSEPGVLNILCTGVGTWNNCHLGSMLELTPVFTCEYRAKVIVNNGVQESSSYFGLIDLQFDLEPKSGFYFKHTSASGNIRAVVANNGTRSEVDTGVAADSTYDDTFHRYKIVNDGGGNAYFYIDGTLCNNMPINTNHPGSGNRYGPGFSSVKTLGSGTKGLQIDQFTLRYEDSRP